MNAERRKALGEINTRITKLIEEADQLISDLGEIRDEEQEYYDNMPESLQNGERGETAQTAIDAIESTISELESIQGAGDMLQEII